MTIIVTNGYWREGTRSCFSLLQWTGISRHALLFRSSVLIFYEQMNHLHMYKCLFTIAYKVKQLNCVLLTAEITVTTIKYIEYNYSIYSMCCSFYHGSLVKFYCDLITRSHLQPINTLIDTFFSKLRAFLVEQRRRK